MGKFPWTISLCTGQALQFLITDIDGNTVMMSEMYSESDFLSVLTLFQRNPEIRVDRDLEIQLNGRRFVKSRDLLDSLEPSLAMRFLRESHYNILRAGESAQKFLDESGKKNFNGD